MTVLEYDGSFAGFLTACAHALGRTRTGGGHGMHPVVVRRSRTDFGLFDVVLPLRTDRTLAATLYRDVQRVVRGDPLLAIHHAFLSDVSGIEDNIVHYIEGTLTWGMDIVNRNAEPCVLSVEKAAQRTQKEAHKFCGLVRFSELADGSLYAPIEPDCSILPLLTDHFSSRFPTFRWIIHDQRRGDALLHQPGRRTIIAPDFRLESTDGQPGRAEPPLSDGELAARTAWRRYFRDITITERYNPLLQRSHMPKKYWRNLTEMQGRDATRGR